MRKSDKTTTRDKKEQSFFALAHRFRDAQDPKEVVELGNQLGRCIFGE